MKNKDTILLEEAYKKICIKENEEVNKMIIKHASTSVVCDGKKYNVSVDGVVDLTKGRRQKPRLTNDKILSEDGQQITLQSDRQLYAKIASKVIAELDRQIWNQIDSEGHQIEEPKFQPPVYNDNDEDELNDEDDGDDDDGDHGLTAAERNFGDPNMRPKSF